LTIEILWEFPAIVVFEPDATATSAVLVVVARLASWQQHGDPRIIPSWARGKRPYVGENGRDYAKRVMDERYGPGNWEQTQPANIIS
jgi:hypothetical protein